MDMESLLDFWCTFENTVDGEKADTWMNGMINAMNENIILIVENISFDDFYLLFIFVLISLVMVRTTYMTFFEIVLSRFFVNTEEKKQIR